jgi:hypothetical protein
VAARDWEDLHGFHPAGAAAGAGAQVDSVDLPGDRPLIESGHLFHVHVCENHRGEFGAGPIGRQTRDLLGILRDAGYTRGVVPELFCETLDGAVHKWIRREGDVTGAAQRSIRFLAACR